MIFDTKWSESKFTRKVWITAFALLCMSCGRYLEDAPSELIPPDKMARILAKIHQYEIQTSRMTFNSYDSSLVAFEFLKSETLKKYKVDSAQFRISYEYYAARPQLFYEIYDDIENKYLDQTKVQKK